MNSFLKSVNIDKESFYILLIGGGLFGLGAMLYQLSAEMFFIAFLFGSCSAYVALPFIDSHKWRPKPLICAILGMIVAIIFALFLKWSVIHILIMGVLGFVLGYLGQYWIRYL